MARPLLRHLFPVVLVVSCTGRFHVFAEDKSIPAAVKMPEPKLVELAPANRTLARALDEVRRQTGILVEDIRGLPDHPLRLTLKPTPFWQSIDAIADADDARISLLPTSGRILLDRRGPHYRLPPICYDGRFRLTVKKMTASRDLEISDNAAGRGATIVAIEVAWDPQLQPLYLETRARTVRLLTDNKDPLILPDDGSSIAPVDGRIATTIDVRLPPLPRTAGKINSLVGQLSMIGPSKMLSFSFEPSLEQLARANKNAPERTVLQDGVRCHITDVKLAVDHWTVSVDLKYPPGMKQLDSNQSWVVNNEMTLESAGGKKRFASTNYVVTSVSAGHAVLSYHFRDKGSLKRGKASDWKLSYRAPADLVEMPIRFRFRDIPLP